MKTIQKFVALLLVSCLAGYGQGNVFKRVRYNGGSVPSNVNPETWSNVLTVTSEAVALDLKGKPKTHFEVPAKSITNLSYGQEAHRRVGTMIVLAVLITPVALFGLMHKTRLHFIGFQYKLPDGKSGGVLLQGDKSNYKAILIAIQGVSGVPVSVNEAERHFVPMTVTTDTVKTPEPQK